LPSTLYTFPDVYIDAVEALKGQIELPFNNAKFEYQKPNELSWIVGDDYKIKLSEASSGFQSFVPLYVVSRYLAESLNTESNNAFKENSIEDDKRFRNQIKAILSNPDISEEVKKASLEYLSVRFRYGAFINIVEEPEQNLFPTSQRQALFALNGFNSRNLDNKLIITTHSPYIISYLGLCVEASTVLHKIQSKWSTHQLGLSREELSICREKNMELQARLSQIVPLNAVIAPLVGFLSIYELDEKDGSIKLLDNYKGLPSDENRLNHELGETNELFAQLLEIQQSI
jgi:hypothetical protein